MSDTPRADDPASSPADRSSTSPSTPAAEGSHRPSTPPVDDAPTQTFDSAEMRAAGDRSVGGRAYSERAVPESVAGDDDAADGAGKPWKTRRDKNPKNRSLGREVAIIVATVLVLLFVGMNFVARQYVIPSQSMENTLMGGDGTNDRIVIDKLVYRFHDPRPGDVVVFKAPTSSWDEDWRSPRSSNTVVRGVQNVLSWFGLQPPNENDLVKRVIATGGQTIACTAANGLTVNGKKLSEPYLKIQPSPEDPCLGVPPWGPITVAPGRLWVMGDNRTNSADSRFHMTDEYNGQVPIDDVRGKVRFIMYPFSRIGGVSDHDPQK